MRKTVLTLDEMIRDNGVARRACNLLYEKSRDCRTGVINDRYGSFCIYGIRERRNSEKNSARM